jgi:RNA polymerase sigma-19 factor, ECF subfamily
MSDHHLHEDNAALIIAFGRGEEKADKIIFNRYFRMLCVYAERITANMQEAEDIVTDVFIRMMHKRAAFGTVDNIKAFLFTATRHACINYALAEKRHHAAHEQIAYLAQYADNEDHFLHHEMIRLEVIQEIYREIENLPPQCRTIFKMLFIGGQSTETIARELSINPQTVRTQKARAIQLIKTELLKRERYK